MAYSTHQDNPALWDGTTWTSEGERYLAELRNLTGVQRQRLLDGRWVAAEGIIWPEFDPAVHLVDRFDIPDDWTRYWTVDFGYIHPLVAQWWAVDPAGEIGRAESRAGVCKYVENSVVAVAVQKK